jgi:hypothetical protein
LNRSADRLRFPAAGCASAGGDRFGSATGVNNGDRTVEALFYQILQRFGDGEGEVIRSRFLRDPYKFGFLVEAAASSRSKTFFLSPNLQAF